MIELANILYWISVLTNLKTLLYVFNILATIILLSVLVFVVNEIYFQKQNANRVLTKAIKKAIVGLGSFVVICSICMMFIPSERNMYFMAILHAGDKIVADESNSKLIAQAERILMAKLKKLDPEADQVYEQFNNPMELLSEPTSEALP